jgi:hypothetical protein
MVFLVFAINQIDALVDNLQGALLKTRNFSDRTMTTMLLRAFATIF